MSPEFSVTPRCPQIRARQVRALLAALLAWAPASQTAVADDELSLLANHYTGVFSSAAQAAENDTYLLVHYRTTRIWPDAGDGYWFYTEQQIEGQDTPYRQRVQRLFRDEDGRIRLRVYTLPSPQHHAGAWRDASKLAGLERDALATDADCDNFYRQTAPGVFEGGTDGQRCRNAWRGASYMRSVSRIESGRFENWDRGFDDEHNHVWGPADGGYQFERIDTR